MYNKYSRLDVVTFNIHKSNWLNMTDGNRKSPGLNYAEMEAYHSWLAFKSSQGEAEDLWCPKCKIKWPMTSEEPFCPECNEPAILKSGTSTFDLMDDPKLNKFLCPCCFSEIRLEESEDLDTAESWACPKCGEICRFPDEWLEFREYG